MKHLKSNKWRSWLIAGTVALVPVVGQSQPIVTDSLDERVARLERMLDSRQDYEMMSRLQELQHEVQTLRGELDEADNRLGQLQKQQQAQYRDLDRRLSLSSAPADQFESRSRQSANQRANEDLEQQPVAATSAEKSSRTVALTSSDDEVQSYRDAYRAVISKDYRQAKEQFAAYVEKFPDGKHLPNAYYWLGEIHLLQHEPDQALTAFKAVVNFRDHHKVGDALLKIGYAYDEQGEIEKAKSAYQDVTKRYQGTSLARLAESRLSKLRQQR